MQKHQIKIEKARRLSAIGHYPATWTAHLAAVPQSVIARVTAAELAELVDSLRGLTDRTKSLHEREVIEGGVWDDSQQRLRVVGPRRSLIS